MSLPKEEEAKKADGSLYHPVRGKMTEKDRLRKELATLQDDSDSDDASEGDVNGMGSKANVVGFGAAMLKQMGLKDGEALRPGASKTAYVPKVTGGFLSTTTVAELTDDQLRAGSHAVPLVKTQCGETVGVLTKSSSAVKGGRVELRFPGGQLEAFAFNQIRLASDTEAKLFEDSEKRQQRKRQREEEEVAWIAPGLEVRIVDGPEEALGVKGVVTRVDLSQLKATLEVSGTQLVVPMLHLATVIPREGGKALMVAGFKKGEMVSVTRRMKATEDATDGSIQKGDLIGVVVTLPSLGEVQVKPTDICALGKVK